MGFGIRKVTPKQIQSVMTLSTTRESIGSHLQKFRLKLVKQYGVSASSELSNQNFPTESIYMDVLKNI